MEDLFKDDFIETMVEHSDFCKEEAEKLWLTHGEKYIEDIWECMGERMYEIAQNHNG